MTRTILPVPVIIGRRKDGRPIYLAQGGSADAGGTGGDGGSGAGGTGDGKGGAPGATTGDGGTGKAGTTAGPFDHITDPAELRAVATRLQTEAASSGGKAREQARAAAADEARKTLTQDIAKALGLAPDEKGDPVKLAEQVTKLTEAQAERDRELAIYRSASAPGMGVDVGRLLDSRAFMRQAAVIDPNSDTAEADIRKLITEAVASDQSLRARTGAAGGSLEHSGGAGDQGNLDLSKLHGPQLLEAAYAANSAK